MHKKKTRNKRVGGLLKKEADEEMERKRKEKKGKVNKNSTGGLRVEWSPATRSIRVRVPASATLFF